jgi:hypothetical protein
MRRHRPRILAIQRTTAQAAVNEPQLEIPNRKSNTAIQHRWEALSSDDPIHNWDEDIIGRSAVVEALAEYALRLRTPIVALHGGLGNGKSSVLNLFRKAVEKQAVVVSFTAWLPGSERPLRRTCSEILQQGVRTLFMCLNSESELLHTRGP